MPSADIHRKLTSLALTVAPELFAGLDTTALRTEYCRYPDLALTGDPEAQRFMFELDGMQFHYLPDAPLENLYRHYRRESNGCLRRSRQFVNPHYEFAQAGIKHYLELILHLLEADCHADAMKATGTLLHVLQDNSFGVHTLEGPGGTDAFFFDRLRMWPESPFQILSRLACDDRLSHGRRAPLILGDSVEEATLRIYRHWCDAIRIGRNICVNFLFNRNMADIAPMTSAAALLSADVLHTLHALARHRNTAAAHLPLNEFEPYEPPSRGPAKLPDGTLTFPVAAEEHLLYRFPAGIFKLLCIAATAADKQTLRYELVNDSKVEGRGELNPGTVQKLYIAAPKNECGFKFYADRGAAGIILEHTELQRRPTPEHSPSQQ
ncbi:MAG: hypothetical protein PHI85_07740 [Victivallaceae bacterium]|nr:hypothetical protein [Victivallaceae bacterium]